MTSLVRYQPPSTTTGEHCGRPSSQLENGMKSWSERMLQRPVSALLRNSAIREPSLLAVTETVRLPFTTASKRPGNSSCSSRSDSISPASAERHARESSKSIAADVPRIAPSLSIIGRLLDCQSTAYRQELINQHCFWG